MKTPDRSQPTRNRPPRLPLALFVIGVFCLFAFFSQRDINRLTDLQNRGMEGRAVITGLPQNTKGGRRAFGIQYRFEHKGRTVTGYHGVSESYHSRARVGQLVLVTHLPEEPAIHQIGRVNTALLAARRQNQTVGLSIAGAVCLTWLILLLRR